MNPLGTNARRNPVRRMLVPVVATIVLAGATPAAAAPPSYERLWGRGGTSGPYELAAFEGGVFAAGYTGGVTAVTKQGVAWTYRNGQQLAALEAGDVSGDGVADAIFGGFGNVVTILDGADGSPLATIDVAGAPEGLAIGDATGDGLDDVFIATRGGLGVTNRLSLVAGGSLEVAWSRDLGFDKGIVFNAASGDLDGDGLADVIFGTRSNGPLVHAHRSSGVPLWSADLGGQVNRVAVGDGGDTVFATSNATLTALDGATGDVRFTDAGGNGFSKLVAGDVSGDGTDDAIWVTYGATGHSPTNLVLATDGASGRPLWRVPTSAPAKDLAVGDLDGDGALDVAATTQDPRGPANQMINHVVAIRGATGTPSWIAPYAGEHATFFGGVAIADVAADARPEVVAAPYFETLLALDGRDGNERARIPMGASVADAIVADLDGDGSPEVVDGSYDLRVTARDPATGAVRWSTELVGELLDVEPVPAATGTDVVAIALHTAYRLDGDDGSILWSYRLPGWGPRARALPGGLLAVASLLPRALRMPGGVSDTTGGSLTILDAASGLPRWTIPTVGGVIDMVTVDANGDGAPDLVTASALGAGGVTAYDGAELGTRPEILWRAPTEAGIPRIGVSGGRIVVDQQVVDKVVALEAADGTVAWETDPATLIDPRVIGFDDLNADGTTDVLVSLELFAEGIGAVDGATGETLWETPVATRFVKAARWTDLTGDGEGDLLYASDGGTFGQGAVVAIDGTALEGEPLWSFEGINAWGLLPVALGEELPAWVAYGVTTLPDALAVVQPHPERPDEG